VNFQVEAENLREQAKEWGKRADHADSVRQSIASAVGKGYDFGFLAGGANVSESYDAWVQKMNDALLDCTYSATYLEAALISTANDYDDTDATQAQSSQELDKLLEESGYAHE
jgi:uncharacterized protein YukE